MSTEEYAALGVLAGVFLIVAWRVRRRRGRAGRPRAADPPPRFFAEFEAKAHDVAARVLESALDRLDALRAHLEPGQDVVRDQLTSVRALANKLVELRSGTGDEQHHHEWDYLAAATLERHPWLGTWINDLDQPMLQRAAAGQQELIEAVVPVVATARTNLAAARDLLTGEPALVWTQLDLVVLTILLLEIDEGQQLAATRHLDLRPKRPDAVARVREALSLAFELVHATPRAERVAHDDLLVPRLDDLDLSAALVRHRIHRARGNDELARARALLLGDPELLWLALAVVEKTEYPQQTAPMFGCLAALVRKLVRDAEESTDTEQELVARAGELFGETQAAALIESTRQLRAGRRPEELFAAAIFTQPKPS